MVRFFLKKKLNSSSIFFCFLTNTVYLNNKHVWLKNKFPKNVFFCYSSKSKSLQMKLFNKSNFFWIFFWNFISFYYKNNIGYFVELELIGLGFRIKKITSSLYKFFWGYANYIYILVPSDVLVEYLVDERLIYFFGLNSSSVNGLSTYLMLLKKMSVYRVTGFVKPGKIIRLNSGKQR